MLSLCDGDAEDVPVVLAEVDGLVVDVGLAVIELLTAAEYDAVGEPVLCGDRVADTDALA